MDAPRIPTPIPCELRALSWDEATSALSAGPSSASRSTSAAGVARCSIGLMHFVPPPLRHIGCMWLEEGDESRRCGKPVAWTVGTSLHWPRFYCEEHGRRLLAHRLREQQRRRRRAGVTGAPEPALAG